MWGADGVWSALSGTISDHGLGGPPTSPLLGAWGGNTRAIVVCMGPQAPPLPASWLDPFSAGPGPLRHAVQPGR